MIEFWDQDWEDLEFDDDDDENPDADDQDDDFDADDDEETSVVPCPSCGADVYEEADRCPHCGSFIDPTAAPRRDKPGWWVGLSRVSVVWLVLSLSGLLTLVMWLLNR